MCWCVHIIIMCCRSVMMDGLIACSGCIFFQLWLLWVSSRLYPSGLICLLEVFYRLNLCCEMCTCVWVFYWRYLIDLIWVVICADVFGVIFEVSCSLYLFCVYTRVDYDLLEVLCWLYSWHRCIYVMWVLFEVYCRLYLYWYVHTGSVCIVGGITMVYTFVVSMFGVY